MPILLPTPQELPSAGGTDFMNLPYEVLNLTADGYDNKSQGRSFTNVTYTPDGVGTYTYTVPAGIADGNIAYSTPLYTRDADGNKVLITPDDNFHLQMRLSNTHRASVPPRGYSIRWGVASKPNSYGFRTEMASRLRNDVCFTRISGAEFHEVGSSSARSAILDAFYVDRKLRTQTLVTFNGSGVSNDADVRQSMWTNTDSHPYLYLAFGLFRTGANNIANGDTVVAKCEFRVFKFS